MSSKKLPPGVEYYKKKKKYFKWEGKGERRYRRYLCSQHYNRPDKCGQDDCAVNKRKPPKAHQQCPCGDGRTLQLCRNPDCTEEGKGSMYCPDQVKNNKFIIKQRCPCPLEGCGASLCVCKKIRNECETCGGFNYKIKLTRDFCRQAVTQRIKSKTNKHEYVKLSSHDFREYIKETFQDGMNWENYGNTEGCWSIGHRTPIRYNNPTEEEMIERLHYTNTFAQWWKDNEEQGNHKIAKT